jgi:four helix bundle protein
MNYQEWEMTVPATIKTDSLWNLSAYRLALFLGDLARHDMAKLLQDSRTKGVASQLCEAVGSIRAKITEGHSCDIGRERAHFYKYALGFACESRHWYAKSCLVLGEAITNQRLELLDEIVRLLFAMIPQQHKSDVREEQDEFLAGDPEYLVQNVPVL